MRALSYKSLAKLSDDLGQFANRYDALRKQIATLHMQGTGTAQSAYFVGAAQILAKGIQEDLAALHNAIYNLELQAQQQKEHEPTDRKTTPEVSGQATRETAQADS